MRHRLARTSVVWLGKLIEHPEIMTQRQTVEELGENIKDAYRSMVMDNAS